jgi:hypothetical protein
MRLIRTRARLYSHDTEQNAHLQVTIHILGDGVPFLGVGMDSSDHRILVDNLSIAARHKSALSFNQVMQARIRGKPQERLQSQS